MALAVALVAALAVIVHQSRRLAACRREHDAQLQSLQQLRETLRQRELQGAPVAVEETAPAGVSRAALAQREASIERLNRALGEARADIAQLQSQLAASSDEHAKALASAEERSRQQQQDWQSRLDALQQKLDSVEADSQASRQRVAALEADNARLRSGSNDDTARAAAMAHVVANLQDLDRRREVYLTSLVRRYRDITSQFRAMSGMLDSSRDQSSSALSSAELTRIQNAISSADDDLRQLTDLNGRIYQLEKKLEALSKPQASH
jgi:chromosome segregation ATPase